MITRAVVLSLLAIARVALADEPEPAPPAPPAPPVIAPVPEPAPAPAAVPLPADVAQRLADLEARADTTEILEQRVEVLTQRIETLMPIRRFLTAYIDIGVFAVGGNGAGVRPDIGHAAIHDHDLVPAQWVLVGDPLSTAINSLGEPADLGASRSIKNDTINSEGHPAVIVNSLALALGRTVGHGFAIAGLAELLPRPGPDLLDVEYAHVTYRPTDRYDLVISAGKVESVLGVEYRSQDAPRRLTVTPSLAARYTSGRPYGVRARLTDGRLDVSATLTNGDSFDERFEPDSQLAFHGLPTAAGHVQWMLPLGQGLEVGASGAVGPQDGQSSSRVHQWHYGFDLRLRDLHGVDVTAEFVQGKQQGSSTPAARAGLMPHCSIAECLTYKAAYVLADWRVNSWLTPYVRVDWRSARQQAGIEFLYVTNTIRATIGVHTEITSRIIAKLEYTANHELGTFQIPNDVLTSSLVVATE